MDLINLFEPLFYYDKLYQMLLFDRFIINIFDH